MKSIALAKGFVRQLCVCEAMAYVCHSASISCTVHGLNMYRSMSVIGDTPFMLIDQLSSAQPIRQNCAEIITNTIDYIVIIMSHRVLSLPLSLSVSLFLITHFPRAHTYTVHFTFIYA